MNKKEEDLYKQHETNFESWWNSHGENMWDDTLTIKEGAKKIWNNSLNIYLFKNSTELFHKALEESEQTDINEKPKENYYQVFGKDVWDMAVDIWGKEAVIHFCIVSAFKYRMRAGLKDPNTVEQDLAKANHCLDKAKELQNNE